MKYVCNICGNPAEHYRRCEEHYRCDECGTKENLCFYGEDGLLCETCRAAQIKKRIEGFNGNTEFTSEITCPHCGNVITDSWEHNQDDGETLTCDDCEKDFILGVHIEVTYSTRKEALCQ